MVRLQLKNRFFQKTKNIKKMKVCFLIFFTAFFFNINAQYRFSNGNESKWKRDIDMVLETFVQKTQKVYLYQNKPFIKKTQTPEFDSLLLSYEIDSNKWDCIWNTHKHNFIFPHDWENNSSKKDRHKILFSKQWANKKVRVLSISSTIYLKENLFIVEISEYCPGTCFRSFILFIEKTDDNSKIKVTHIIDNGGG